MSDLTSVIPRAFLKRQATEIVSENERRILALVRKSGSITRAQITRETGLTAQSISRLVSGLVDRGFLKIGEAVPNGRGQPSAAVEVIPEAAFSFGIGIHADYVAVAMIDFSGRVVQQVNEVFPSMDRDTVTGRVTELLQAFMTLQSVDPSRVFGIGIGISGYFVGDGSKVNPPEVLEDWALMDLDTALSEHFSLPVWIENDGNVSAIGEYFLGAGRWAQSYSYLHFSRGFGGGLVVHGKPVRGAHGNAGEYNAFLTNHGFERMTLDTLIAELASHGIEIDSVLDLQTRFDPTWPGVEAWIERVREPLSVVCTAITVTIDPDAIVFGGCMPKALAQRVIEGIRIGNTDRRSKPLPEPRLVAAEAPADATAIGAAALPFQAYFFT